MNTAFSAVPAAGAIQEFDAIGGIATIGGAELGAELSAVEQTRGNGWLGFYRFRLPEGAEFFLSNREAVVPWSADPSIRPHVSCFDGDLASQQFVIVGDAARGAYVLVGVLSARYSLAYLTVQVRQRHICSVSISQPEISAAHEPEAVVVLVGTDWRELLVRYAERVSAHAGQQVQTPASDNALGYCTWYYSYQNVTEAEFMANVALLEQARDSFAARYAQIDDGYQSHHGDWLCTNANWPSGLEAVATQISGRGFVPGIWAMPLLASTASDLFTAHPDWFVTDAQGQPLVIPGWSPPPEGRWVCLDISRKEVQAHIRHVFSTLYRWGYRYFKLDGLGLSYPQGGRHDPQATGISCLRKCFEIIRECVGDAIVLNCGGPFQPLIGLADHARLGGDTGMYWRCAGIPGLHGLRALADWEYQDAAVPSLSNALANTFEKWWLLDRWYRGDPDVVMLRDEHIHLSAGQARLSGLSGILTGVVFTSDRLDRMSGERRELLHRVAAHRMCGVRPLATDSDPYLHLFSGSCGTRRALAVFNTSPIERELDLRTLGFEGAAAQETLHPLGVVSGKVTVPACDGLLLLQVS